MEEYGGSKAEVEKKKGKRVERGLRRGETVKHREQSTCPPSSSIACSSTNLFAKEKMKESDGLS